MSTTVSAIGPPTENQLEIQHLNDGMHSTQKRKTGVDTGRTPKAESSGSVHVGF